MPSTECGVRNAECGMSGRASNAGAAARHRPFNSAFRIPHSAFQHIPHSALRIPHLLVGAMLLVLLPTPVGAQHPDSLPKDTTTLAPVVVTGVRLPTVREIARGL